VFPCQITRQKCQAQLVCMMRLLTAGLGNETWSVADGMLYCGCCAVQLERAHLIPVSGAVVDAITVAPVWPFLSAIDIAQAHAPRCSKRTTSWHRLTSQSSWAALTPLEAALAGG
jgi:hypothetical protein